MNPLSLRLRRLRRPIAAAQLVLALFAAGAASTASAGWDYLAPSDASATAKVVDATAAAEWLLSNQGSKLVLLRKAGAQSRAVADVGLGARLLALDDGGVLLVETNGSRSALRRFDAQGLQTWQRETVPARLVLADAAGGLWLEGDDYLLRLAADGSEAARVTRAQYPVLIRTLVDAIPPQLRYQRPQRAVDTSNGNLLVAGNSSGVGENGNAQVALFDRKGAPKWIWSDAGRALDLDMSAVASNSRGVDCAAGRTRSGGRVVRLCFDASGQPRWTQTKELGANASTPLIAVGSDGSLFAVDTVGTAATLSRLSPSGAELWRKPLPGNVFDACAGPDRGCALRLDANNDATVVVSTSSGVAQRLRLVGLDAAGNLRFEQELPISALSTLTRSADGGHLAVGAFDAGSSRLLALSPSGQLTDGNVAVPAAVLPPVRALAYSGEASYVVAASDDAPGYRISRIDLDGRERWSREIAGHIDLADASANANRVCVAETEALQSEPNNRVRCLSAVDGELLWQRVMEEPFAFRSRTPLRPSVFALRADDTLELAYVYRGVQLYDPNGNSIRLTGTDERAPLGDMNTRGDSVIVERPASAPANSDAGIIKRVTDSGRLAFSSDLPTIGMQPDALVLSDNDVTYVVGRNSQASSEVGVWMIDANGGIEWRRALSDVVAPSSIELTDESIVVQRRITTGSGTRQVLLDVLRRDNGNRRWRKTLNADAAAIDASNGRVLLFSSGSSRWNVRSLTLTDGTELGNDTYTCPVQDCTLSAVAAADGIARVAAGNGASAQRYVTGAPIRVDQPGLNGAWGSLYGEGEGLVLDWLPQARLLFMPWFTYARSGANEAGDLRWFVAQAANVPNDARQAELEIYSVSGGVFDNPAARQTTRVGSATLRFSDCANGRLDYRFDGGLNSGASGSITLSRLSPDTVPCILADGTTRPASAARPPSKGFDARQSGSWYEPATGGQGLQLTVQPDGVFFGAWFTYDAEGAANDNEKQHWFTLYGNLAQAVNGRIELALVQTIGGGFDRTPTRNRYIVGSATLQMHGCDRASLSYRFDDKETTGPYAGRSGEIELIKEGGCGP